MYIKKLMEFVGIKIMSQLFQVQLTLANFNLLFWFMHFCSKVHSKTLKKLKLY